MIVQNLELSLVGFGNIGKILIIVRIYSFNIRLTRAISEMVPSKEINTSITIQR